MTFLEHRVKIKIKKVPRLSSKFNLEWVDKTYKDKAIIEFIGKYNYVKTKKEKAIHVDNLWIDYSATKSDPE
jgi:hypothetical protein